MAKSDALILKITDFDSPESWRWELTDGSGKFLADHEVKLDASDVYYSAFKDLYNYLKINAPPDKRIEKEELIINELGAWIGQNALGPIASHFAKYKVPLIVRVIVPPEASGLIYRPWEIAQAGGKTLAKRKISLVFEIPGEETAVEAPAIEDRMRMLAVFSMPTDVSALSLRRERYELMKLINGIAKQRSLAIDLRILQYGATRDSLREALLEGEGWDIIHFSGHGEEAALILEKPDGSQDSITSEDLAELLSLASGRLKLIMLSACLTAAATLEETLRWLKLSSMEQDRQTTGPESTEKGSMPSLAWTLVDQLDCAALAMRYPVGDEFAIRLANSLYDLMLAKGQSLARSLPLALEMALQGGYNAATPPISPATPALFGRRALDLTIKPPSVAKEDFQMPSAGLAYFPDEPERFVGRVGPMGRASSAMAGESEKRGVLFQGMAGAGKTACALELAYHQSRSQRFQAYVWYRAPAEGDDIGNALTNLALDMEKQLPGFKMVHIIDQAEELQAWLPRLSEFLEQKNILIVLDNLETLLSSKGEWRDSRWGDLVGALLNHNGLSRLILTSRVRPNGLDEEKMLIVPIYALSLDEAMLLAREMPNLGKMLTGRSSAGSEKGRDIVMRTLKLVQGHPKLIELADAQAADSLALEKYLEKAIGAWSEEKNHLDRFFLEGRSARTAEEFLEVLTRWTQDVSASLPSASGIMFQFLCAMEDEDRMEGIVQEVWPELWKALGRKDDAPGRVQLLDSIKSAGLVQPQLQGETARYIIHPGVAQAELKKVDEKARTAVDMEMASFWSAVFDTARRGGAEEMGQQVITAGLRSAPYLMRQKIWPKASYLLEQAIYRDRSPETVASVLPLLRHIADATMGTDEELGHRAVLANTLLKAGRWSEAEAMLNSLIHEFIAKRDFKSAWVSAGYLFNILWQTGRFDEALNLVDIKKAYASQAGLGRGTRLLDEVHRLQALNSLGRCDEVLHDVYDLRDAIKSMPKRSCQGEAVEFWNVWESILDIGQTAAMRLNMHERALELNSELMSAMNSRNATKLDLAGAYFNIYYPLLRLERLDEARRLLLYCKDIFERESSLEMLGMVFGALSDLEFQLGHLDQAISFNETAMRFGYVYGEPETISVIHNNLAICLGEAGFKSALDHRLASALIRYQIGSIIIDLILIKGLAWDLEKFGVEALPGSFNQLCSRMEMEEGVRFRELWERLPKKAEDGDLLLKELIEKGHEFQELRERRSKEDKSCLGVYEPFAYGRTFGDPQVRPEYFSCLRHGQIPSSRIEWAGIQPQCPYCGSELESGFGS